MNKNEAASPQADDYPNFNLGSYHRPVATSSPAAQRWFDRGLLWSYSFNHGEVARLFERAVECDPTCALAYWGIAYAVGPNYNIAWGFFDIPSLLATVQKAWDALNAAQKYATHASPLFHMLLKAIATRFPTPDNIPAPTEMRQYNQAFADAMRVVYEAYPEDIDVASLYIEALICVNPRELWYMNTGEASSSHTLEAKAAIDTAMARLEGREHPALCHLYIHLMEMSATPEVALPAADRLRRMIPDASHMVHMPAHIDMAVGDYRRAINSSDDAIVGDDMFFATLDASPLYVAYRVHNIVTKLYCAMMSGRSREAMLAADKLDEVVDAKLLATKPPPMADWTESFLGSHAHVLVRFGRWEEILQLELPAPQDRALYCCKTANILYARGLAFSALGRIQEAEVARQQFEEARKRVPRIRINNLPGNIRLAFATLRRAIELEDGLAYCDPPAWMQPVRHALGGLLLEQKRVPEAEQVFREDLGMAQGFPRRKGRLNNVWGLHGLHECLVASGKMDEARVVQVQLDIALGSADVPISTSCYCRLSAVNGKGCCARL
ncbi:tetratricopeptide repeat domain protein [Aspergillus tubingensis]|uniref:tetratricopeptide repeat domain protein n=1 Tax=Aspergillus tubingensis TaxID=5068 RepID=UPI0015797BC5|nr:tetratricopeptide repeat domain protein [Aspergillus tubingensis]GFN20625.1 tetratricopeptide repeat domain protein [Aspergillus tubingensis]